jgi:hypothetical protein
MRETLIKRPTAITPMPVASGQLVAVRRRSSQPQHKPRSGMIERHCITTAEGCMGWIATALPGRVRSWLGLRLTMATHCDHATNMLITSQHVSIVERLADRHGPT